MTNVADRSMGLGLKAINRIAGLEFLDRIGLRKQAERVLFEASKNGSKATLAAGRTFAGAARLGKPARQPRTGSSGLFDLTPTEEQQMLREALRDFAAAEIRPKAQEFDTASAVPQELLKEALELGIATFGIPEELGGVVSEQSTITGVLAAETLAHGDLSVAFTALAPGAVATALGLWGTAEQQGKYLEAFTADDVPVAALALLEPRPLFDPFSLQTKAERLDDGSYAVTGVKSLVPRGAAGELFVVGAEIAGRPGLFLVTSAGNEGRITAEAEPAMGLRAAQTARVSFDSACAELLGGPDADLAADYAECVQRARLAWCALTVGCGQAVLDYVIPYVNERQAFGEPISHRQSVAFMVSDIAIELDGLRLTTYRAASRADQGKSFDREVALARRLSADKGMKIGSDGVQLLGGHGYVKEYPVERWYRDLRAAGVMEGALLV